jgi:hypothetical protein
MLMISKKTIAPMIATAGHDGGKSPTLKPSFS